MPAQSGRTRRVTELQRWMSAKGLKDWQVAEQLGLSRTQVSRIRRGLLGASMGTARRLEQLTRRHYWKFLKGFADMQLSETGVSPRYSRSKRIAAAPNSNGGANIGEKSNDSALDRNTAATEMLTAAIQKLLERFDHVSRTEALPVKSGRARADDALLTINEVCAFFGGDEKPLSKSAFYRLRQQGRLPRPVKLAPRSPRWRKKDCEAALKELGENDL